jgi:hypothetical protein
MSNDVAETLESAPGRCSTSGFVVSIPDLAEHLNCCDPLLATPVQVRAIKTILSRRAVFGPKRCDVASQIIRRQVTSLDDLSKSEATAIIDTLTTDDSIVARAPDIGSRGEIS